MISFNSFFRKIKHYLIYFFNLFFQNPKLIFKEYSEDYRKDKLAKEKNKDHHLILICSLPKAGSTLIEEIISYNGYVKLDRSLKRFYSFGKLEHVHDISEEMIDSAPKNKLSFIKTHTHFSDKNIEIINKFNMKKILVFRDLRDVMISRYYHIISDKTHRHHKAISNMDTKEGFIASIDNNQLNKDNLPLLYYYNWIKDWKEKKKMIDHLELWYEDYVLSPYLFLSKILNYIGETQDEHNVILLEKFLKKNREARKNKNLSLKLKDKSKKVSTFRKGKIENWKVFFDSEISDKFNNLLPGPLELVLKK